MKEKVKLFMKKMGEDNVSEFSAECSYYIILAFVPFLILLISLIQYTGIEPNTIYDLIVKFVPQTMSEQVIGIIQEVYSKSIATISISIIFTFFSAQKGFFSLVKGLNKIYEIKDVKYLNLRLRSILNTIIFIIIMVLILAFSIFGNDIFNLLKMHIPFFRELISFIISKIIIILFTFLVYIGIYKFIPKHKVSFKSQAIGALIGSLGLLLVSYVFSKYLSIFRGFSIMYGSLTAIMLVIMWTYTCIYTLFLGAEINKLIKLFKNNT